MGGADGPGGGAAAGGDPARGGAGGLAVRLGGSAGLPAVRLDAGQGEPEHRRPGGGHPAGAWAGAGPVGTAGLSDLGGGAAGSAPAPVRPAAHRLGGAGRLHVVFSARRRPAGAVDGPGEAVCLCPGGTGVPCGAAHGGRSGAGPLPVSDQAGAPAAPLERGRDSGSLVGAPPAWNPGVWALCRLFAGGYGAGAARAERLGAVGRGRLSAAGPGTGGGDWKPGPGTGRTADKPLFCAGQKRRGGRGLSTGGEHDRRPVDLCGFGSAGRSGLWGVESGGGPSPPCPAKSGGDRGAASGNDLGNRRFSGGGHGGELWTRRGPAGESPVGNDPAAGCISGMLGQGNLPPGPISCV